MYSLFITLKKTDVTNKKTMHKQKKKLEHRLNQNFFTKAVHHSTLTFTTLSYRQFLQYEFSYRSPESKPQLVTNKMAIKNRTGDIKGWTMKILWVVKNMVAEDKLQIFSLWDLVIRLRIWVKYMWEFNHNKVWDRIKDTSNQ